MTPQIRPTDAQRVIHLKVIATVATYVAVLVLAANMVYIMYVAFDRLFTITKTCALNEAGGKELWICQHEAGGRQLASELDDCCLT